MGVPFNWRTDAELLKRDFVVAEQVEALDTVYTKVGLPNSGVINGELLECSGNFKDAVTGETSI